MFDISVIIPTINRHDVLKNTLIDLNKQKEVSFEVIVIDQSEHIPDAFLDEVGELNYKVSYYRQRELSASKARNVGLLKSTSEIVLFFDDDVIVKDENLLANHLSNYKDESISGVFGQILLTDEVTQDVRRNLSKNETYGWLFFPSNYTARVIQKGIGMAGNLSVRKDACIATGGMDHNFEKGAYREESDFVQRFWKNGFKIVFDPTASLVHIGHKSGGIRSWGASRGLCSQHHIVGEWYFILKHGFSTNIFMNLYSLLRRQIINRINLKSPINIPVSIYRSGVSFIIACNRYRSVKDLKNEAVFKDIFHDVELINEKNSNYK
ncbi:glycosyltransferase [Vibrio fluvialis]|nr:glycosyltransferase [Vibrio fluvialis]